MSSNPEFRLNRAVGQLTGTPPPAVWRYLSGEERTKLGHHLLQKQRQPQLIGRLYNTMLTSASDPALSVAKEEQAIVDGIHEEMVKGSKYANLAQIKKFFSSRGMSEPNIPSALKIPSDHIEKFLKAYSPKVFDLWTQLEKVPFESEQATKILEQIDKELEGAFTKATTDPKAFEMLIPPRFQQSMAALSKDSLMVRSAGAEDSATSPNAGGNISKAYVPCQKTPVCQAIGEVVRSYFGRQSLQNRINAKANPFQEKISFEVMVQKLIGETVGGETDPKLVPTSFVLFTNEPVYIQGEKFRVMCLNATYGHGEAVVSSQGIETDTFYLLRSEAHPDKLYILSSTPHKKNRLGPVRGTNGHVSLQSMANPQELSEEPSVKLPQLVKLFTYGLMTESLFKNPTDIEGVIKDGKIYFVQGRDIVRGSSLPTYLNLSSEQAEKALQGETLAPGRCSAVFVKSAREVVFAETIDEAEKTYNTLPDSVRQAVKLVIVAKEAPDNSHPVVNFKSLGVPCLIIPQFEQAKIQMGQAGVTGAACMQRGLFVVGAGLERAETKGFAVHPIHLRPWICAEAGLTVQQPNRAEMKALVARVYQGDRKALQELHELCAQTIAFLPSKAEVPKAAQKRIEILEALYSKTTAAIEEVEATWGRGLNCLLHIKVLESLLAPHTQVPGSYTWADVPELQKAIEIGSSKEHAHCTELLLEGLQAPYALENWKQFLTKLNPEQIQKLSGVIAPLKAAGSLPTLLALMPPNAGVEFFNQTLAQITPAAEKLLEQVVALESAVTQQRKDLAHFANPAQFEAAWKKLQELFPSGAILREIKGAAPIVQTAAYGALEKLVTLLDDSIKTMKASPLYSNLEKPQRFKRMLLPYAELMSSWVGTFAADIPMTRGLSLSNYLLGIRNGLLNMSDRDMALLSASRDFSVSAAIIGSLTAYDRHPPRTLEDMMTLLHQNTLAALSFANQKLIPQAAIQDSQLPAPLKEAVRVLEQGGFGFQAQRIGVTINSKEICFDYNVPINNHSGHIALHYDVQSGQLSFKGKLLGQARDRWPPMAAMIRAFDAAKILETNGPTVISAQELLFSWKIDPAQMASCLQEYNEMVQLSLRTSSQDYFDALYRRWEAHPQLSKAAISLLRSGTGNIDAFIPLVLSSSELTVDDSIRLFHSMEGDLAVNFSVDLLLNPQMDIGQYLQIHRPRRLRPDDFIAISKRMTPEELFWTINQHNDFNGAKLRSALPQLSVETLEKLETMIVKEIPRVTANALDFMMNFYQVFVDKGRGVQGAIEVAKLGINTTRRRPVLALYRSLVMKGHAVQDAIEAVKIGIGDPDAAVKTDAVHLATLIAKSGSTALTVDDKIHLFHALEGDLAVDFSVELLLHPKMDISQFLQTRRPRHLKSEDFVSISKQVSPEELAWKINQRDNFGGKALTLMQALGDLTEESLKKFELLAAKALPNATTETLVFIVRFYERLVWIGRAVQRAIEVAELGMKTSDPSVHSSVLALYQSLVSRGHAVQGAIAAAKTGAGDANEPVRSKALYLYEALVRKGSAIQDAIGAAKIGAGDSSYLVRANALDLYVVLVRRGYAIQAAIAAVKMNRGFHDNRFGILSLCSILVQKGHAIQDAIEVAKIEAKDPDGYLYSVAQLYTNLIRRGHAMQDAAEAAKLWVRNPEERNRERGFELYAILVKEEHAIQEATEAARIGTIDQDRGVRREANNLEQLLARGRIYRAIARRIGAL